MSVIETNKNQYICYSMRDCTTLAPISGRILPSNEEERELLTIADRGNSWRLSYLLATLQNVSSSGYIFNH